MYTAINKGCWISGAEGRSVDKMAEMLTGLAGAPIKPLPGASAAQVEQYLAAGTTCLQANTEAGMTWVWDFGDLILQRD